MTKWLRWQGLIAFVAVVVFVFLAWYFLVNTIVRHSIEKAGTRIVGARVELAKADVHLFPLGISLVRLQITNPDKPMSNVLEAGQIDFAIDSLNLLRRKIIINTMTMEGVRFNTPRKTSGAVNFHKDQGRSETSKDTPFAIPGIFSFQLPDIHEILAREKLESLEHITNLREEIETAKADWEKRLADAPDENTFEQYQARAKKLQKGSKGISGTLTKASDLKNLQKDISKDLKRLKDIQKKFARDKKNLTKKLDQLKSAPQHDVDRILNTYNLSSDGLGNVSQLLFGDKIGGTVQKAIFWYGKISPLLTKVGPRDKKDVTEKPDRGKGVYVRFKEESPLPDLLARQVGVSTIIEAGNIKGELRQVTTDQAVLGIPLEFNFSGVKLQGVQSINIKGSLDHIDPNKAKDQMTIAVQQYRVNDLKLSATDNLPLTLKKGLANLNLTASIDEEILDAHIQVTMDTAELEAGNKTSGNKLQQALHAALADVSTFSVNARVTGPLDNYKVKMTSDLDKILKNAVGRQMKALTNEFQNTLRAGISDKIKGPMADTSDRMSGLDSITQEISSRLDLGNDVSGLKLF